LDGGVIHENIDGAELSSYFLDHMFSSITIAEIDFNSDGLNAEASQPGDYRVQRCVVAGNYGHISPESCEGEGCGLSDASAATGHDNHAFGQRPRRIAHVAGS
jgi:hypothetical protein